MLQAIVTGGQTGVDRAALRAARALGLRCGGWCPKGRRAEDGQIPAEFCLAETESSDYSLRTQLNVRDSDATLVIARGVLDAGTQLTVEFARSQAKPFLIANIALEHSCAQVANWLSRTPIQTLNIAGPRESQAPDIGRLADDWLRVLFAQQYR